VRTARRAPERGGHRPRQKVAAGSARVGSSGSATVKVRFTKAARKRLRRARTAAVALKVTFTPASGAPATQATTVAMRR
jgi:hypothetical protein